MAPRFLYLKTLLLEPRGTINFKTMLRTNFFKTIMASMLVVCASGFYSCSSDDDDPNPVNDPNSIIGKWDVQNPGVQYGSFEFTEDKKYIITEYVYKDNKTRSTEVDYILIIFGDYNALNSGDNTYTIDLKQFGKATITLNSGKAEVNVNGKTYNTQKYEADKVTDKTKLLCHTWYEKDYEKEEYSITFTTSGTYVFYEAEYNNGIWEPFEPLGGTWEWTSDGNIRITDYNDDNKTVSKVLKLTENEFVYTADDGNGEEYTAYLYR